MQSILLCVQGLLSARYLLILITILFFKKAGAQRVELNASEAEYYVPEYTICYLPDTNGRITLHQILQAGRQGSTCSGIPVKLSKSYAHWYYFRVVNHSDPFKKWILEFHNFSIDSIELYRITKEGILKQVLGDKVPFSRRSIFHKNIDFELDCPFGQETEYVVRTKNAQYSSNKFYIRSLKQFTQKNIGEYFLIGIYYGVLVFSAAFVLALLILLKDRLYFYYLIYTLAIALFSLSYIDGLGFQFVWPECTWLNDKVASLSLALTTISLLLYFHKLLVIKIHNKRLKNLFVYMAVARLLIYVSAFRFPIEIADILVVDTICLFTMTLFLGRFLYLKELPIIMAFVGLMVLFMTFLFKFHLRELLPEYLFGFPNYYLYNVGVIIQMLILSSAMAFRIKSISLENEQIKNEMEINRRVLSELETRVELRTSQLEDKNHHLDHLIYKVAHDVRGPLNSIIGLSDVYLMEEENSSQKDYLVELIKSRANKLKLFVSDVLNLSKTDLSKINPEEINLASLVKEVIESIQVQADQKNIQFEMVIPNDLVCFTDRIILYSVVQNLMENGVKYHDNTKKERFIRIVSSTHSNGFIEIKIEDNGLGMNQELAAKAFDLFFQGYDGSAGSGIGLHLVKKSLEKLGGSIRLKTELNMGSVFIFRFPQESVVSIS